MKHPLSLEAFTEWASRQPAEKRYSWWNAKTCAVGQYAKSLGFPRSTPRGNIHTHDGFSLVLPREIYHASMIGPYTFGALTERLLAGERT